MSAPLHDLISRYVALLSEVDGDTGEVPVATAAELDALAPVLSDKIEALAGARARLLADGKACAELAKQYAARAKAREAEAERIERYTMLELQLGGLTKIKGATASVWLQSSERVTVDVDVSALGERFRRTTTKTDANKEAIKDALKAGEIVAGARLESVPGVRFKT